MSIREWPGRIGVALGCLVGVLAVPALGQSRLSDRILISVGREDAGFFVSPRPGDEWVWALLAHIARSARVPIGFEEVAGVPVPSDHDLTKIPLSARTYLTGRTVGGALNALVSADARYRWQEQDGLILIRPAEAWTDPGDFLSQALAGLHVDAGTASDVARAIYGQLGVPIVSAEGGSIGAPPGPDAGLKRRMAFDVPSGSVLEALNNVVRAHGGVGWMVRYSHAPAEARTSCVRFFTFNGHFSGVGAACHP
jgi:hypothetical protein